jgi:hypothetical protein
VNGSRVGKISDPYIGHMRIQLLSHSRKIVFLPNFLADMEIGSCLFVRLSPENGMPTSTVIIAAFRIVTDAGAGSTATVKVPPGVEALGIAWLEYPIFQIHWRKASSKSSPTTSMHTYI